MRNTTKTGKRRVVPLPAERAGLLREHRRELVEAQHSGLSEGWVLPNGAGRPAREWLVVGAERARSSTLAVTAFTFFAGTLGCLPFAGGLPQALAAAPWPHVAALLWLGIAPSFVGYLAWNVAVHRASASRVSSFIYLSPPIAIVIGWLWLGEVPGAMVLAGGAIVIGGVVLANTRRRAAAPAALAESS